MTRPNIVRADTIDLQDQDNPSAAEHQKPQFHGGLAPHQRAEVHHVLEERDDEEHALADAWNIAGSLTEEPGAIEQAQLENGDHDRTSNGTTEGGGESETEGEDDMMDRISSSPSIDDGGYIPHSSPPLTPALARVKWPVRTSSLSPSPRDTPTSTQESSNKSPSSTPDSSPFLQTPQHLPLHVRRTGGEPSRLVFKSDWSSSPFDESPTHLPAVAVQQADHAFSYPSEHHHSQVKYSGSQRPEPERLAQHKDNEEAHFEEGGTTPRAKTMRGYGKGYYAPEDDRASEMSLEVHGSNSNMWPVGSPFRTHAFHRNLKDFADKNLEPSPSLTSTASMDLQDVLLPIDDPLLDTPPSPTDSADSWESLPSSDSDSVGTNDDDTDALFANLEPRFIDSGWGGECLRDTEDIDFEFVYALHTFVATVEGQANATKGDTMVLLDDSNSYWWLVRVVKDSSIGYLPAEHIETPTERLARLNKHRNIDLSATMLSDNSEKTRNPLKKAIRRRNAKTVQFAAPTYVDASDYDYDTEDEELAPGEQTDGAVQSQDVQQTGEHTEEEQIAEKRNSQDDGTRPSSSSSRASFDREQAATVAAAAAAEEPQLSPKLVDKTEAAPLKSRKTRNTDSFFKDDSIETRKITLTPGLLREEGSGKTSTSTDSTRNNSLESLVKQISPPEPLSKKDSKKEKKEKKGGMLSGLFKSKKKDKKSQAEVADFSDAEKPSVEYQRDSPRGSPLTSGRTSPSLDSSGIMSPTDGRRLEVQSRQPSRGKLQKPPPSNAPTTGSSPVRELQTQVEQPSAFAAAAYVAELQGTEAAVEMAAAEPERAAVEDPSHLHTELALKEQQQEMERPSMAARDQSFRPHLPGEWVSFSGATPSASTPGPDPIFAPTNASLPDEEKNGPLSPIMNLLKRDDSQTQKPVKAKKSKQRVELDDFDSPTDDEGPNPFKEQEERATVPEDEERLSDSPVEITHNTFMHGTEIIHIPTPSPDDQGDSDVDDEPESLTSSPSIIEHPAEPFEEGDAQRDDDATPTAPRSPTSMDPQPGKPVSTPSRGLSSDSNTSSASTHLTPSTSVTQQTWSDSSLRAWLEDGSEVKDMMVMIHDKSGVVPVSDDHPMMAGLFTEQRKGVQGMMTELDGLLGSYLQRKGIALG